jgi:hypothetical protein
VAPVLSNILKHNISNITVLEMYSITFLWLSLLEIALASPQAAPTATTVSTTGTVNILTSFTGYVLCNDNKTKILQQTAIDAQRIADAGLDAIHDELFAEVCPQKNHQQVDFSKQAAIDFLGPESQNFPEQVRIFGE